MRLRALICTLVAVAALVGCGDDEPQAPPPDRLTIATALPLQGAGSGRARDVLDGERLALTQAGGRAGEFEIDLHALTDATPEDGWQPGPTVDAARAASEDPATIAYVGDLDAGATALSLPTTNAAGVLQVSPGTTYDGFTGGPGSIPGEPEKYRPSGVPSFGRIAPGDTAQAVAMVDVLETHGCRRAAVLSAPSAFEASLAELVAAEAQGAGIRVVLTDQVRPEPESQRDAATEIVAAGAGCVAVAAGPADLPAQLLRTLHAADAHLRLVAGLPLAADAVARELGPAAAVTEIVGPPPPSRALTAAFRREYGRDPGPWAAYGHEAMRRILAVIELLGERGNDRAMVRRGYLARYEPTTALAVWRGSPSGLELVRELPRT